MNLGNFFRKKHYAVSGAPGQDALKKLLHNPTAIISAAFILLLFLVALLGYTITPDPTPFANRQQLELNTKKPGFRIKMLRVKKQEPKIKTNFINKMLFGEPSTYQYHPVYNYKIEYDHIYIEEYTGMVPNEGEIKGFHMVKVVYAVDTATTIVCKNNIYKFRDISGKFVEISRAELLNKVLRDQLVFKTFLLGTDRFGRDLLSQLMIGTRVSLSVGFISVIISLIIGILLGSLAGYFLGWVDNLIMWFINVVWSIPTLLLVIAITFVLGKGFWQIFIAVGLTMWVEVARVIRGQILSIREKEYVEAAVALGYSNFRIIFRHILPNVMSPVIVISAANFASAILIEAGLSFLGIGVQPPIPSWGTMIKDHYGFIILDSAYLAIIPGVAIMLTVLAFMLLGNALRDALDVKIVNK